MQRASCFLFVIVVCVECVAQPVPPQFDTLEPVDPPLDVSGAEIVPLHKLRIRLPKSIDFSLDDLDPNHPVTRISLTTSKPWIRLQFHDAVNSLTDTSLLVVRSTTAQHQQSFVTETMTSWNGSTVAFNGPSVELLMLDKDTVVGEEFWEADSAERNQSLARIREEFSRDRIGAEPEPEEEYDPVIAGERALLRLCLGALEDRRLPSGHPWVGRLYPYWCSAFMIGPNTFLTANHCFPDDREALLQFNVPLSKATDPRMPHPRDQYRVKLENIRQSGDPVVGNDWAIFSVWENTESGQIPGDSQAGFFKIAEPPAVDSTVFVVGHGKAGGIWDRYQQLHFGPLKASDDSKILNYRVDTADFNSGSPVLFQQPFQPRTFEPLHLVAVGIHKGGLCNPGDPGSTNSGTAIMLNGELMTEIENFEP